MLPGLLGDGLLLGCVATLNYCVKLLGLHTCQIACALHYVYSKAGWVVECGY